MLFTFPSQLTSPKFGFPLALLTSGIIVTAATVKSTTPAGIAMRPFIGFINPFKLSFIKLNLEDFEEFKTKIFSSPKTSEDN